MRAELQLDVWMRYVCRCACMCDTYAILCMCVNRWGGAEMSGCGMFVGVHV